MSGAALIAFVRECHKDCGGCPVEDLCAQHEALLAGAVLTLTPKQVDQVREFCGMVIRSWAMIPHDIYDEAYCILAHFPQENTRGTGEAHASQ